VLPPSAEALETALPGLPGRLVDALSSFATSARFRYRHRWTAGDVVVWDNTATMHAATKVPTESEAERTMWRTTIAHDDGPEHPEAAAAMAQRVFRIAAA
jgi:alpha-ketoglutarate-dependent taurine dioxygenase